MFSLRRIATVLALAVLCAGSTLSPVGAVEEIRTTTKIGASVRAAPDTVKYPTYVVATTDRARCNFRALAWIQLDGDDIYVRDMCPDGLSAVAIFQYTSGDVGHRLICRNPHGANTIAKCEFNWSEKGTKSFYAGYQNGPKGKITQGFPTHFIGG